MDRQDITGYGSGELSLHFMNDEGLYLDLQRAVRREDFDEVERTANQYFEYTPEQLEDLRETFDAEVEEYWNEELEEDED